MMLKPNWNFKSNGCPNWPSFMLSSAEEDLLAGKISVGPPSNLQAPLLPAPVQQPTAPPNNPFWTFEFWKNYFNVDTKDVFSRSFQFLGYDENATRLVPIDSIHDDHCRKSRSLRAILGPNHCYILLIRGINHRRKYCSDMVRKKVQCNGH